MRVAAEDVAPVAPTACTRLSRSIRKPTNSLSELIPSMPWTPLWLFFICKNIHNLHSTVWSTSVARDIDFGLRPQAAAEPLSHYISMMTGARGFGASESALRGAEIHLEIQRLKKRSIRSWSSTVSISHRYPERYRGQSACSKSPTVCAQ